MKKVLIAILTMISAVCMCVFATSAFAPEESAKWTTTQSDVTVKETTVRTTFTGTADNVMSISYSQPVDFSGDLGASFRFVLAQSTATTLSKDARTDGSNYIDIKILNANNIGIRMRYYALYSSVASSEVHKADVDVFYVDPAITAKNSQKDRIVGERYLETIELYDNVEGTYHTLDFHKEQGFWFFALDGLTAVPRNEFKTLDLSSCTVTVDMYSKENAPSLIVYPFQSTDKYVSSSGNPQGKLNKYIVSDFIQFGSDEISYPGDDTVKLKVADKRAAQYPNAEIRYREHLVSSKGYDVRKPINIEYSYDVSNASAVWYAFGLGRKTVLEDIQLLNYNVYNKITYTDENGVKKDRPLNFAFNNYGDSIAAKNDGIMIQTTTGLAQPVYRDSYSPDWDDNQDTVSYKTNSTSKPYEGRGNIDLITFVVGEECTELYMNGTKLFARLHTKLSDFADNDYMAYPYFHFFEDRASTAKGNTIVIKGVNAARRTDDTNLKVVGGSNKDLVVGLDNIDNGEIKLYHYVDSVLTPIDASLYSYKVADKQLTVKYDYFNGKEYGIYKLYARNNSGSEEIEVRLSDPALNTLPPETDKAVYDFVKGGDEDLVINVDIHNGIWKSFSGAAIPSSSWTRNIGEDGKGTITIAAKFLNERAKGQYTFTIRTTNVEEEEFSYQFKIRVYNQGEKPTPPDSSSSENPPDSSNESSSSVVKPAKKCGAALGISSAAALLSAAGVAAVVLKKRK